MAHRTAIDFDSLRVSTPCQVSWGDMTGDARKRFCGQCSLHVYDVSELTRGEAETLIRKSEGRICMRLHRRADGRIVTKDCGRVRAALERRVRWVRAAAASVLALVGLSACNRSGDGPTPAPAPVAPPDRSEMGDVVMPSKDCVMGIVAPLHTEPVSEPK